MDILGWFVILCLGMFAFYGLWNLISDIEDKYHD